MRCFPGGFPLEYAATKTIWGLQNIDHSLIFIDGGGELPRRKITHSSMEFKYYKSCFLFFCEEYSPNLELITSRLKKLEYALILIRKLRKILNSIKLILENSANDCLLFRFIFNIAFSSNY